MRPDLIVEGHVARHPLLGVGDGLIGMEIDLFIFEAPPQPFDEHIIPPPLRPIHTDLNVVSLQESAGFLPRQLAALVRVEDLNVG